ncbi:hypothetical protein EIP86_010981 [Pleurotus ostreatoroseus]|nr:hypothetical protein EIP86_010981 [Pleurotus ostreatoroseus]
MRATSALSKNLGTLTVTPAFQGLELRRLVRTYRLPSASSQVVRVDVNLLGLRTHFGTLRDLVRTLTGTRTLSLSYANDDTRDIASALPSIFPWLSNVETLHLDSCHWTTLDELTKLLRHFPSVTRLALSEQSWKRTGYSHLLSRNPPLPRVRELMLQNATERRNPLRHGKYPMNEGGLHFLDWLVGKPHVWAPEVFELGWEKCYVKLTREADEIMRHMGRSVEHLAILPHTRLHLETLSPETVNLKHFTRLSTLAFKRLSWSNLAPALKTVRGNGLTELHLQFLKAPETDEEAADVFTKMDDILRSQKFRNLKTLHVQLPNGWQAQEQQVRVQQWMPQVSERTHLRFYQASETVIMAQQTDPRT